MNWRHILRAWLPLAALAVLLTAAAFLLVSQAARLAADEAPAQLAAETAAQLAKGTEPWQLMPAYTDPAASLGTFVQVYDATGRLTNGSALLDGVPPRVPAGVLERARARGEARVTWEPRAGVRIAAVIVPLAAPRSGFVLAGRSLAEVDQRVTRLGLLAALALFVTLAVTLAAAGFAETLAAPRAAAPDAEPPAGASEAPGGGPSPQDDTLPVPAADTPQPGQD